MTVDPPRRLRPRAAQRNKTITTQTKGAPSAKGSTAAARPVTTRRNAQQYVPPSAIVTGDTTGQAESTAIRSTTGTNSDTDATGVRATALGFGAVATGDNALAGGVDSVVSGNDGTAFGKGAKAVIGSRASAYGRGASASQDDASAFGSGARAFGARSVALGFATDANSDDDFVLGNNNHNVQVPGNFILADVSTGNLYRLDVTGGVLTLVAYP